MRWWLFAKIGVVSATAVLCLASSAPAETTNVDFGKFVISVSDSETAETFQIVDMLSDWDPASTHRAYLRWARDHHPLNNDDQQLLKRHAELRRARGWGQGFEQAFLVDDTIAVAVQKAIASGVLSADEANAERTILEHFLPLATLLRVQARESIRAFKIRLDSEQERLAPLMANMIRFAKVTNTIRVGSVPSLVEIENGVTSC